MSADEEEDKSKTANAILEMLKEAGVSTKNVEDKKHAFWDTQVGRLCLSSVFDSMVI
jgi:predicted transcriptional regulator